MSASKRKFSVLLLRPDYVADNFGQDTHLCHVYARSVARAMEIAQREVATLDCPDEGEHYDDEDYHVLLIVPGHIHDLTPRD